MRALENASDAAFVRAWLQGLIAHEQGAVRMAATEVAQGQNSKAVALARQDEDAHTALLARLRRLAES
jgi:uncharacterized protein (DUF305 family)